LARPDDWFSARRRSALRAISIAALALGAAPSAAAPVRVATLLPYVQDALGRMPSAQVQVVAAARRSLHQPTRAGVADLGTPHSPSLEPLAAARPQIVVGDASMHALLADAVKPLGAELMLIDSSSVDATFAGLEQLAARVGSEAEMKREVEASRSALAAIALAEPVPTLALFGTPARWLVVTERSWLGDLMTRLRLDSVARNAPVAERIPGYAELSDEAIAGTRPELVLIVTHGDPRQIRAGLDEKIGPQGPWSGIAETAVDGVHVLDPALFTANPGLALPDAARALVALTRTTGAAPPSVGAVD